jgi:hypothetical protein
MPKGQQGWAREHNRQATAIHLVTHDGRHDNQCQRDNEGKDVAARPGRRWRIWKLDRLQCLTRFSNRGFCRMRDIHVVDRSRATRTAYKIKLSTAMMAMIKIRLAP